MDNTYQCRTPIDAITGAGTDGWDMPEDGSGDVRLMLQVHGVFAVKLSGAQICHRTNGGEPAELIGAKRQATA